MNTIKSDAKYFYNIRPSARPQVTEYVIPRKTIMSTQGSVQIEPECQIK